MMRSIGAKPLAFTTPVWVVGTYDAEGKPNPKLRGWRWVNNDVVNFAASASGVWDSPVQLLHVKDQPLMTLVT